MLAGYRRLPHAPERVRQRRGISRTLAYRGFYLRAVRKARTGNTARGETMDTQQLKQLPGRLRALLEGAAVEIGLGQALDLSASLVGLRNWPEVQAFPQRVQAREHDLSATARSNRWSACSGRFPLGTLRVEAGSGARPPSARCASSPPPTRQRSWSTTCRRARRVALLRCAEPVDSSPVVNCRPRC